ncbi:MAG TPA: EF-hand domain-containing protein [Sphingomicrobium sp.]|nr:EF-hand domain-containing protein [Sphingomicrobium sp.]
MTGPRKPKKSETLEVRLPHEVKSALMGKAHAQGRSASEVVRRSIDAYLAEQPKEARSMLLTLWKPAAALGTAALAMWAAISPAPLHAKPDLKAVFQIIDRNSDGAITRDEFVQHTSDPAIQKMHEAHNGMMHHVMAAMHGNGAEADHARPSKAMIEVHFAKVDANSDGSVTFSEFQAFHDQMMASHETR